MNCCLAWYNIVFEYFAGQLFGHIHKDDMRFQRLNEDKFDGYSSFLLTAPGITPLYRNNPGFRLVSFDKEKQLLTNYDQYYMDLVLSTREYHFCAILLLLLDSKAFLD